MTAAGDELRAGEDTSLEVGLHRLGMDLEIFGRLLDGLLIPVEHLRFFVGHGAPFNVRF